jgi:hypothetical protein
MYDLMGVNINHTKSYLAPYMDIKVNTNRLHASLGYLTPLEMELIF